MKLPEAFINNMNNLIGKEETTKLFKAIEEEAPTSIRLNPYKSSQIKHLKPLDPAQKIQWAEQAYYLSQRPAFTYDPLFHAGAYYVQEASSMCISKAFSICAPEKVRMLDLCAAPGGKSTLWRSHLPEGSLLVANEPMPQRAHILRENLLKWGHPDTIVSCAYPKHFKKLKAAFDVIATDVPCSGEGMFRKDEGAIKDWSNENVEICWQRQREIISDIWPTLRKGGYLLYSTCTYNQLEDEQNIEWICQELGAQLIEVDIPDNCGILRDIEGKNRPLFHFFPHQTKGEGFFFALLKKDGEEIRYEPKMKKSNNSKKKNVIPDSCKNWLEKQELYAFNLQEEAVYAINKTFLPFVKELEKQVNLIQIGIPVATLKGKKVIPQHGLALSIALNPSAFPSIELKYEEALSYLHRETLSLDTNHPRGYVLVTYRGLPLGFVNNLGTRANNLYPQEWRIRNKRDELQVSFL